MKNKIAAFIDKNGNALPIVSTGAIHIFEIRDAKWLRIDQFPFSIKEGMSIREIRSQINQVADRLHDCIALIVNQSRGLVHSIFEEELHLRIFLATGNPIAVLFQVKDIIRSQIVQAIERVDQRNQETIVSLATNDGLMVGCYQLDLIKLAEKKELLDSKEIILSFLQKMNFVELEIICIQKPKWLDEELEQLNFNLYIEYRKDGFCHAFVRPKYRTIE